MHSFCELIERSTLFSLQTLAQTESEVLEELKKIPKRGM